MMTSIDVHIKTGNVYEPRHAHDRYTIGWVESGAGAFYARGVRHEVSAGDLVFLEPNEPHTHESSVGSGWRLRVLGVDEALVREAVERRARPGDPLTSVVIRDRDLGAEFAELHRTLAPEHGQNQSAGFDGLRAIIGRIAKRGAAEPSICSLGSRRRAVYRAVEYLEEHFARGVDLPELADIAEISKYHLARSFSEEVGVPPHSYQIHLRVAEARRLIRRGVPIGRAAIKAGFYDQSHLNRHFKRLLGMTPGDYANGALYRRLRQG